MSKSRTNSGGNKTLLALALLVIIAAVGFGIVHFTYKSTPTVSTTGAKQYVSFREYSGQQLSFKYPVSWGLRKDTYAGSFVLAYSPASIKSGIVGTSSTQTARIAVDFATNPSRYPADCVNDNCRVLAIVPLSIPAASAKLVIYNVATATSSYSYVQVVDDPSLNPQSTTFKDGVRIQGIQFKISGQPLYGVPDPTKPSGSTEAITDVAAFQKSAAFVQLVQLLNSLHAQ